MRRLTSVLLFLLIAILATAQGKPAYVLYDKKGRKVKYGKMIRDLSRKDFVLFGELHNNPISHWLQLELTKDCDASRDLILAFEMLECKAVIKGDWKILFMAPPYGKNEWHLYNLVDDPQELTNVADKHPEKFQEMLAEWESYAQSVGYIEASGGAVLEDMSPEEFFAKYGVAGGVD